jgi:nucleoside phosphorylase
MSEKFKDIRIAVIIALAEEYKVFREYFPGNLVERYHVDNIVIDIIQIPGAPLIGAVCINQMGNIPAAITTSKLIRIFDLDYIVNIGLAGGVDPKKQSLGDVIIAEQIRYYEMGKVTSSGFSKAATQIDIRSRLINELAQSNFEAWPLGTSLSGRPRRIFFGNIASGEKVISDSEFTSRLLADDRKTIGIEMEGYGIASAVFGRKENFLLIRGLSDFADAAKGDSARLSAIEGAVRFFHQAFIRGFFARFPSIRIIAPSEITEKISVQARVEEGIANNYVTIEKSSKFVGEYNYRKSVIEKCDQKFDSSELKVFCIELKIDYDNIKGETKREKIAYLIAYIEKKNLMTIENFESIVDAHP